MITWTVGSGGLLGGAVERAAGRAFGATPVPWSDRARAGAVLAADAVRFADEAGQDPWRIVWAAGAATVAATQEQADSEVGALRALLESVRAAAPPGPGCVFITSSAGGVYAGSAAPPFDATTVPAPISAYGRLKLAQEALAVDLLHGACPVVIGRVANLYGPGQNLAKLQGLVSRLVLAALTQRPINIFVPLETTRDYVYVDDAAADVIALCDAAAEQRAEARVAVIASGAGVSVGQLVRSVQLVTKRRVPIALGTHPSSRGQVVDLRLVPTTVRAGMALPAGIKRVQLDLLARLQRMPVTA